MVAVRLEPISDCTGQVAVGILDGMPDHYRVYMATEKSGDSSLFKSHIISLYLKNRGNSCDMKHTMSTEPGLESYSLRLQFYPFRLGSITLTGIIKMFIWQVY